MTFERQFLIETSDIKAVHFECGRCKATIVIPTEKLETSQPEYRVSACPYCHAASGIEPTTAEYKIFVDFVTNLGKVAKAMQGRTLKLKLSIECPEAK